MMLKQMEFCLGGLQHGRRPVRLRWAVLCSAVLIALASGRPLLAAAPDPEALGAADHLLMTGNYAEGQQAYQKIAEEHPVEAAIGGARCLIARGKYDQAVAMLTAAATAHPENADLAAELAAIAFGRGQYDEARRHCEAALKQNAEQLQARWLRAELARAGGDLEEAHRGYQWLVDHYNATQEFTSAADLHFIGLGAAQFARWSRLSDQFSFLVNELYPDALKLQDDYWPAHLEAGRLFLEKYNEPEARRQFEAALQINPHSADIHAALAELAIQNYQIDAALEHIRQAQAVNPNHLASELMLADVHLANFEPARAIRVLEKAQRLNPVSPALVGRLAAAYGMCDGLDRVGDDTRFGKMLDEVTSKNGRAGDFYFALAVALDKGRRFPRAAHYLQLAIDTMPQLVGPRGQLGLMQMRLGDEEAARKTLDAAFEIDPFNVRVVNSLRVLEVLDTYQTLETDHFLIRYDDARDHVLARCAARYLEQIYPELCGQFDYTPPGKSLFEIFHDARNTDAHSWFGARMVGLPDVHTIGACAGKMVALTSPTALEQPFSWARVLKHEFVHVLNLQQTDFKVPHWFTEAVAVHAEALPRSAEWNALLARRVAEKRVFDLDTINRGFIRPASSDDWQMAYCQAELYAEYMLAAHGADALNKMLAAYRDNLSTPQAIERALGVSIDEFERGYTAYVERVVAALPPANKRTTRKLADLLKAHEDNPDDLDTTAELAVALLSTRRQNEAGELANRVLASQPKHQLAAYVKARLLLSVGEAERAEKLLSESLDRDAPRPELVKLLADVHYKAGHYNEAEQLYQLGARHDPAELTWPKSLALVYLKTGNDAKLYDVLVQLADAEPENATVRKKLARLAFEASEYADAARWANQAVQIDVMDVRMHQLLGRALAGQEKYAAAADAWEIAVELAPDDPQLRLAWAENCQKAGQSKRARKVLTELVHRHPGHSEATAMLEKLAP